MTHISTAHRYRMEDTQLAPGTQDSWKAGLQFAQCGALDMTFFLLCKYNSFAMLSPCFLQCIYTLGITRCAEISE